jgi:hypothetical protein
VADEPIPEADRVLLARLDERVGHLYEDLPRKIDKLERSVGRRVDDHESRIRRIEHWQKTIIGGLTVVSGASAVLWAKILG